MAQSGLTLTEGDALRAGVVMGTGGGGNTTTDAAYRAVYAEGKNRVHPFTVPRLMHNAAAAHLAMRHGLKGPSFTVSTACASSNHAMGLAFQMVRGGACDVMLTGGSEATLCFGGIKAWEGLRVMSPDGCRPFCATRNGMVQGEGAAVFVFEDWERATRRGAPILAEVVGFAMTSDASDIVQPDPDGAARAMRGALADAGLGLQAVGYINAHGTGTAVNDRGEVQAIRTVFGRRAAAGVLDQVDARAPAGRGGGGGTAGLPDGAGRGGDRPDRRLAHGRPGLRRSTSSPTRHAAPGWTRRCRTPLPLAA